MNVNVHAGKGKFFFGQKGFFFGVNSKKRKVCFYLGQKGRFNEYYFPCISYLGFLLFAGFYLLVQLFFFFTIRYQIM